MAKKVIAGLLLLKEVLILAFSVFVGHMYQNHGGCGRRSSHDLRHDMHLIPASYDMKDAVVFECTSIFAVCKKAAANSEKEGGKPDADGTKKDD